MEERLVEALDFYVQDSVNKALVKALRLFAQPIFNFGLSRFGAASGNPTSIQVNLNEPGRSDFDPFEHTIKAVLERAFPLLISVLLERFVNCGVRARERGLARFRAILLCRMAGYDDQAEDLYYMDDTAGSFDQDLVYALDAGMRHSVTQAFAQAIQPIKHHLLGLVDQQAWAAPTSAPTMGDSSFAAIPQPAKQPSNPHTADFQFLLRNMAREHDYNA
ncbi:hypothetical protein NDU88_004517 [Pleurodeles waltl]|uniref:Uncharacterized protein n=1 Tax=Pleurodeles waltl TaxID=8319 RepID=A0AAV7UF87_PLEWA|nr:hypothetical protein NDU88_004517 [Pleurodeles waltl]